MHNYPSDISREEFEIIREELEGAKKKTRPRRTDLYWRMLPSDFPKWQLCYYYFRVWSSKGENGSEPSIFEKVLKKISKNGTQ